SGSAAFSPDGTRIVTASDDNTARIWDAPIAKEIAKVRRPDAVTCAAFSTNETRIVTGTEHTTAGIRLAHLPTMSMKGLLAEAGARLAGLTKLTWDEMRTKLTRDEMRLAGYPDSQPEIDVCQ